MIIRTAEPTDYAPVIAVVDDWWGGRHMSAMLPKLFFIHFRETTLVAEEDRELVGFLSGFLSQTDPEEAYIHFVGVNPEYRQAGVGRLLYERFFEVARRHGRHLVRCVTSPVNKSSIAFHTHMGFGIVSGNGEVDGISVHRNYDGQGEDRVLFVKAL
ncbi:MAG: GNAT family N-acetyltransferase [Ardenticatenaceae bacterium]|nr:GNAT family N-acetyltransferase [Ardenticatenaceae bacterium]HBY95306.1 GNAT family N-acetyltransferase [Chloroflexota bacterium]